MAKEQAVKGLAAGCTIKQVPDEMLVAAAADAILENPANAPIASFAALMGAGEAVLDPQRLAVMTQKYWGSKGVKLTVSFLDNPNAATRAKVLKYANEWGKHANVSFTETASGGDVRIARASDGYWSYLGTDVRSIPRSQATMNLQGFTERTSDAEYARVVIHEFGHTLGFPHEHARPAVLALLDESKTIKYFRQTQGWDERTVRAQILTPLNERTLLGSNPEVGSIMCYDFPGQCTKSGKPIMGGADLTATDKSTVGSLYPKAVDPPPPPPPTGDVLVVTATGGGKTYSGTLRAQ